VLQTLLALIDLVYHGPHLPSAAAGGSSAAWHAMAEQHLSLRPPSSTCPQARFSHLTIYGASYYSYLYARCLSEALWGLHLAQDPLNPDAGVCVCVERGAVLLLAPAAGCSLLGLLVGRA
jgi:intermediate peptidase